MVRKIRNEAPVALQGSSLELFALSLRTYNKYVRLPDSGEGSWIVVPVYILSLLSFDGPQL